MKNILLFLIIVLSSCSSYRNLVHNQQIDQLIIDGKDNDWGKNILYDSNSKLFYKVSNNQNTLFIMLKISDPQVQRKMLAGGLTICIDTTDHKQRKFEVIYPKGNVFTHKEFYSHNNPKDAENTSGKNNIKEILIESELEIELRMYGYEEPITMLLGESKLKPVLDVDDNQAIIYEFALPISYFIKNRNYSKPISIGIIIGSEVKHEFQGNNQREGHQMGGGMHNGMGRGMRGGMRGDSPDFNGRNMNQFQPVEVWLKNYVLFLK